MNSSITTVMWTLICGFFTKGLFYGSTSQILAKLIGVIVNFILVEVEFEGLDQSEVAVTAYPDFSIMKTRR